MRGTHPFFRLHGSFSITRYEQVPHLGLITFIALSFLSFFNPAETLALDRRAVCWSVVIDIGVGRKENSSSLLDRNPKANSSLNSTVFIIGRNLPITHQGSCFGPGIPFSISTACRIVIVFGIVWIIAH